MPRHFSARFATALAAEPTVLAPGISRSRGTQPGTFAWAVAATLAAITVVGYTAYSMVDAPPSAVAKAREAATMRAAQVSPPVTIPADYLLAHQEYSPATTIQGVGPYVRAVAATAVTPSPSATQTTR
jgi:sigma-E factor negative regulatory protein RseA